MKSDTFEARLYFRCFTKRGPYSSVAEFVHNDNLYYMRLQDFQKVIYSLDEGFILGKWKKTYFFRKPCIIPLTTTGEKL